MGTKLTREVTRSKGVQGTEEFLVTFCNQKFVSEEFSVKKILRNVFLVYFYLCSFLFFTFLCPFPYLTWVYFNSDEMGNKGAFITMGTDTKPNYTTYDAVVSSRFWFCYRRPDGWRGGGGKRGYPSYLGNMPQGYFNSSSSFFVLSLTQTWNPWLMRTHWCLCLDSCNWYESSTL